MKPLVSIWCMTYNQVEYIRDAIDGFLMQKTSFPYEIVIHDDASTDGTVEVLQEYEKKYPDLIRVIYQKRNTYKDANRRDIIDQIKKEELHGKYVAYCEGDDYWIDSDKLQKQVDYLETHENCIMVTHNGIRRNCRTMEDEIINKNYPSSEVGIKEILYQNPIMLPTASIMIRNQAMHISGFFLECDVGDYPLKLYAMSQGYIYYMDDVMIVYRYMSKGSWSVNRCDDYKFHVMHCIKMIEFLKKYNVYTQKKYENYIIVQTNRYANEILARVKDLEEEKYIELWNEINEETDSIYNTIFEKIYPWHKTICNEELYIKKLKEVYRKDEDIILWGTGRVTKYYLECLERHNLNVKGFVVTKREPGNEVFLEKKVWELQELLKEKQNTNLVVAVWLGAWASILDTIFEYDIKEYYYPFYYEIY